MSTTAGPNVPFRKGSLYFMPAIDTDASPTPLPVGPSGRECSVIVTNQDLWNRTILSIRPRIGDATSCASRRAVVACGRDREHLGTAFAPYDFRISGGPNFASRDTRSIQVPYLCVCGMALQVASRPPAQISISVFFGAPFRQPGGAASSLRKPI